MLIDVLDLGIPLQLWCTGQAPNTSYIQQTYPSAINPTNSLAYVNRHLQLSTPKPEADRPDPRVDGPNDLKNEDFEVLNDRIFVTGDCADAFGSVTYIDMPSFEMRRQS